MNETGSFPDESEKTPMCYMQCFLDSLGVLASGSTINKEMAAAVYDIDDDSLLDDCMAELGECCFCITSAKPLDNHESSASATVTDECEKAYFFVRCIKTQSVLNGLQNDDSVN